MSLDKVLSSLSQAASLLQANRNGAAVQILSRDVKAVLSEILMTPATNHGQGESFDDVCHVYTIDTVPVDGEMKVSPDNSFCFYQKAFGLKVLDQRVTASSVVNQLTGIAMYNLALAYHREGIQRGASKLLHEALSIYRVALSSLRSCPGSAAELTLIIAISNNMGLIHSVHFAFEQARLCSQAMSSLLQAYPVESGEGIDKELLSVCFQNRFFSHHALSCAPTA